jgi:hypothetical protein
MKSTYDVAAYDYSELGDDPNKNGAPLGNSEFWGIHSIGGRIHVDVDRYCAMCKAIGIEDFVPQFFRDHLHQKIDYLPKQIHRYDYSVNEFRDLIAGLNKDWVEEFKPVFRLIRTPKQVEDDTRMDELMYTGDSDDYDDIEVDARIAAAERQPKYEKIIRSLYFQNVSKVTAEVDRYTLLVIVKHGYKGADFSLKSFEEFTDGLSRDKNAKKISALSHYNTYSLLHKVNNFLKHNSLQSYESLAHSFPKNVVVDANHPYENGMFAEDWIILKENYIDNLFGKLTGFFEDYCHTYLEEDIEESKWNYDEYFVKAAHELSDPMGYIGLPY